MLCRLSLFITILLCISQVGLSQNCDRTIVGSVKDLGSSDPIEFANVYLKELQIGDVTDSLGFFNLTSICNGKYHLSISHIGCATKELFIEISNDTIIDVLLDHNSQLLNEVSIVSEGGKVTTQESQSVNSENISQNTDKNLANMLENIAGVSTIRNGKGISKPVVHGLSGNRLTILNNGVAQSGQQWGVDHAPEIDPLVANRITVVKGVALLEYQGSSLGSVILVEPKRLDKEPHLHGETRYFFESNGLSNGLNLVLQKHSNLFTWRITGTLKGSGDNRTSNYYLRNTGNREANLALQIEKAWNQKWHSDLYLSTFNSRVGVLRGSHIGNLTDLEDALDREIPFFTEDEFSYSIDAPYQNVNHHLIKTHSRFSIKENQWIDFSVAGQYNLRKEFDVRRSGRSEFPALSLEQYSTFVEVKYQSYFGKDWSLKSGLQWNRIDNANLPETGILPLIPDYISDKIGVFGIMSKSIGKTSIEFSGRYDFENRNVATISTSIPREIIRYNKDYSNLSSMVGINHEFAKDWKLAYNAGYAARNPEVNELYSGGLHQGVSGIEEGDPDLSKEVSFKNTLSFKGRISNRLTFDALIYQQNIRDYIFLSPQDEIRLTIRGAFPVFKYKQTNARLRGIDFATSFQASDKLYMTGKYSFLHGFDISSDIPLVFMPANNLYGELNYQVPKLGKLENVEFQVNNRYVFEQKNLLITQDFVAPPAAYNLLGLKISAEKQLQKLGLNMFVKAENLLNSRYRDYLNRQRYFADGLGVNIIFGLNVSF